MKPFSKIDSDCMLTQLKNNAMIIYIAFARIKKLIRDFHIAFRRKLKYYNAYGKLISSRGEQICQCEKKLLN